MKNEKLVEHIVNFLQLHFEEVKVAPTHQPKEATIIASNACGIFDVIVVAGGDGTINEVINAIANKPVRPKLGIIPTGTTNDLAHSLKIPKNINKALNIITNNYTIKHDIFKVNQNYGIYVCAFGIFTNATYLTSQQDKRKLGILAYFKYGIKDIFKGKAFPLTLKFNNTEITNNYALCIIANSKYVAGHKINKKHNPSAGYVTIALIKNKKNKVSLYSLLTIAKLFLFGINSLRHSKKCCILKINKFSATIPENITTNLDGEKGTNGSFNFKVLNKHVEIFVNKKRIN